MKCACLWLAVLVSAPQGRAEADEIALRAGAAEVIITPGPRVPLSGYYNTRYSDGVHDELRSKAIVLEVGGTKAALAVLDLISLDRATVAEARRRIEKETGIPGERVMLSATHTHTAPAVAEGSAYDAIVGATSEAAMEYRARLPELIARSVELADRALAPARASWGIGQEERLSFNRRFLMEDGSVGWNPGKLNPRIVRPAGPIDPAVPVVRFDSAAGAPLAACVNFAMHLDTVGGTRISADYPHTLSALLRRLEGEGFLTLFTIGCAGDLNHIDVSSGAPQQGAAEAERIGTVLAGEVLKTFARLRPAAPSELRVRSKIISLPLAPISPGDLDGARAIAARAGDGLRKDGPKFMELVEAFKVLDVEARGGKPLDVEVQAIALGDEIAWVSLPGEIFVELGLAIRKGSPFPCTILSELSNGAIGYIPTRRAYAEGNYEPVSARCGPGSGEMLVETALELLRELKPPVEGPLSPGEALRAFRAQPGLRVELAAAEPIIMSPVALAFDEAGRMFVAEDRGYPQGPGPGKPPAGVVARLEDRDGDGVFETRTDFATGLTFPNGVLPWKGGVIVTCAPDALFFRDEDGDGRADTRAVLLTGFSLEGSTQLRVCHPLFSPDGWIYLSSGLSGGKVTAPGRPDLPAVGLIGDLRFRPDPTRLEPVPPESVLFEAADGRAQFGGSFDEAARRFICYNRVQAQLVVLSARHLRRNPHLSFSETVENLPEALEAEPLPGHGRAARIHPLSRNVTTADSHAGTFTAACGVTFYRGTGLPSIYRGCLFSCDPTGNLVHCDRLIPSGAVYRARALGGETEFLASTDDWFRPVSLAHGPDGALYVCDMYRKTIEHPDYLPEEVRKRTDFEGGKDRGRIYRVIASAAPRPGDRFRGNSARASTTDLCLDLAHPDGWRRDLAHRLLLERRDLEAVPLLKEIAASKVAPAPAAARALRILDGWGRLGEDLLAASLTHADLDVRETAIQLAERRLAASPKLLQGLLPLAEDREARVRFEAALALGASNDPRVPETLARIAALDAGDRWARAAILSSSSGRELDLLRGVITRPGPWVEGILDFLEELGRILGAREAPEQLRELLSAPSAGQGDSAGPGERGDPRRLALWSGIAAGFAGRGGGEKVEGERASVLQRLAGSDKVDNPAHLEALRRLEELLKGAAGTAADPGAPVARRKCAISLLARSDFASGGRTLLALLDPDQPLPLQTAAARAIGELRGPEAAHALLEPARWRRYAPAAREAVIAALLSRPEHALPLLHAVQAGEVPPTVINSLRRRQLLESRDPALRERAVSVLSALEPADRRRAYDELLPILKLPAHPENGRRVFRERCSPCHRLDQEGIPVGPDLFGIRNQSKEAILLHVTIPEAEILPGFTAQIVETRDGRTLIGILAAETETSITLRSAGGVEETVLRARIAAITRSSLSLMPQEIEKLFSRQDLADLIAYVKGE